MPLSTLDELVAQAEALPSSHMVVAAAHDLEVLRSVDEAQKRGIATADLIGDAHKIEAIAAENSLDLRGVIIEDQTDDALAAVQAMGLVREGRANMVVKGQIQTTPFLRAVLDREHGIRDRRLLSHVGLFEIAGLERLFEMIAAVVDGHLPRGENWHQTLLEQVAAEAPTVRPAVISDETRWILDEYRGFRHVVPNVYTFRFDPAKVQSLVERVPAAYSQVRAELLAFANFLDQRAGAG